MDSSIAVLGNKHLCGLSTLLEPQSHPCALAVKEAGNARLAFWGEMARGIQKWHVVLIVVSQLHYDKVVLERLFILWDRKGLIAPWLNFHFQSVSTAEFCM